MKLSDAIALGRTIVTLREGVILAADSTGCALGMAGIASGVFAVGKAANSDPIGHLAKVFPWAVKNEPPPPCGCQYLAGFKVSGLIGHIFDHHIMQRKDWTLDQLIDWVATVEPAEEPIDVQRNERMRIEHYDSLANT